MDRARVCGERKQQRDTSAGNRKVTKDKKSIKQDDLSGLIDDADAIFSKYIRFKDADENGYNFCYTSGEWEEAKYLQCGHYVSRNCFYLRWDERNCHPQSGHDNVALNGNLAVFAQKLNEERPGIVDILEEEAHIVFKPSREDIRAIISEYSAKLDKLKK